MGKFHIKMGNIYNKLAGVLMEKGEYETALSFYAKTYTIMDTTLGIHDDTKQALDNIKLAAEKARGGKSSVDLLLKAEEEFKKRHPSLNADSETESDDDKNGKKKSGADTKKSSTSTKGSKTATSIVKQEEEADII
jgi:DNA-binding SARP family transcriptional activator